MPKKASIAAPEVATAIAEIKRHCETTHTSVLALSQQALVAQSALARFLAGERKSITSVANKVLQHIKSRHNWHNRHNAIIEVRDGADEEGCRLINEAISSLWDGRRQSAAVIASLVLALKPAIDIAASPSTGGQTRN